MPIQLIYKGETKCSLAKCSLPNFQACSHFYSNEWFSNRVAAQLNRGVDPTEVKTTSQLSDLKPLHASWIADLFDHLKKETGMIIKGFDSVGITEAVNNTQSVYEKIENPFQFPKLCALIKKRKE